jgi:RNA polymerase sigma-70 factor (ECF subfamily)
VANEDLDAEWMKAYQLGDRSGFDAIYGKYSGKIYGYLTQKLSSKTEADEVFQEVFLKFHRFRHKYDFKYSLLQWLYVISNTTLADHYRKSGRSVLTEAWDEKFNEVSQTNASQALIPTEDNAPEFELSRLNPEQKAVLEMRVIGELEFCEIASRLGKSEQGVRQILSRTLKKLRAPKVTSPGRSRS